jgi:predicted RecB family endonuclease
MCKDNLTLYDYIVFCYACDYNFSIQTTSIEDIKDVAEQHLASILGTLRSIKNSSENEEVDKALEELIELQEYLKQQKSFFNFAPENILIKSECNRLKKIKGSPKAKYQALLKNMSDVDKQMLRELLNE